MKKISMMTLLLCLAGMPGFAAETAPWLTSVPAAQTKARAEKKLVFLDFTGSDWCVWCKRLHNEILSTPEFTEYAAKNLMLVEVDFPRAKPQSDALKAANEALQQKYKIKGYPTVIVLDGDGNKVGELGYQEGGPKPFIAQLEKLKTSSHQAPL